MTASQNSFIHWQTYRDWGNDTGKPHHSFLRPSVRPFVHSFTHSLIHLNRIHLSVVGWSKTPLCLQLNDHVILIIHSFAHSFIHLFIHSFMHSFIDRLTEIEGMILVSLFTQMNNNRSQGSCQWVEKVKLDGLRRTSSCVRRRAAVHPDHNQHMLTVNSCVTSASIYQLTEEPSDCCHHFPPAVPEAGCPQLFLQTPFPGNGPRLWNSLPADDQSASLVSLTTFRQKLKTHLFRQSYPDLVK